MGYRTACGGRRPNRFRGNQAEAFAVIHRAGAQQEGARLGLEPGSERFGRVLRFNFLDQRAGH